MIPSKIQYRQDPCHVDEKACCILHLSVPHAPGLAQSCMCPLIQTQSGSVRPAETPTPHELDTSFRAIRDPYVDARNACATVADVIGPDVMKPRSTILAHLRSTKKNPALSR